MKKLVSLLAGVLLALPLGAAAQQGQFNEVKPPVPVEGTNKIEVIEFFWYGCIHCYNLEPALESWIKTLPKDVEFRRVPAVFNERWALDASIFYALEALGLLEKLHRPLFDAIHRDRLRTDKLPEFSAWLEKQGVDAKKVESATKSFAVQSKTKRAARMTAAYKIDGTPAMAVHGRYTVASNERMLEMTNQLVAAARKNK